MLFDVNLLISFPLNDKALEDWAYYINRLLPDFDLGELRDIIDRYATGALDWDSTKGIQNILRHIQAVKERRREMIY